MVCYAVPAAAAIVSSVAWAKKGKGPSGWWLNLMLYGGALFGLIDHWWNGELFFISEAPLLDLLLGAVITAGIFISWGITIVVAKSYPSLAKRAGLENPS